jgi:pyruvate,water dikinase
MIQALKGYLAIPEDGRSPDAVFAAGEQNAREALRRLQDLLRATRGGRIKAALAGWLAGRVRALMGLRESPKFFAARAIALTRGMLLREGGRLAAAGLLDRAEDIFLLHIDELIPFATRPADAGRELLAKRRARMAAEEKRVQIPRILLGDGTAYYEGVGAPADLSRAITGSPVSPGVAEGIVRVVFDPRSARLTPGDILVCPGTDPAWTPLFLSAGALVMEVGGMMTHGSVVAREYGIPAVVGVHAATTRLRTGQRVRVDGSKGLIEVLAEVPEEEINHSVFAMQ